jgi:hypothetical protein
MNVIQYVIISSVVLDIEYLSENSRTSKDNCVLFPRRPDGSHLLTPIKALEMFPRFSRTCRRPSSITRFVHGPGTILDADKTTDGIPNSDL